MEGLPKNSAENVENVQEVELQNLEKTIEAEGGVDVIKNKAVARYGKEWETLSNEISDLKEKLKSDSKNLKLVAALVSVYNIVVKKNRQLEIEEYDKQTRPKGYSNFGNSPKDVGN